LRFKKHDRYCSTPAGEPNHSGDDGRRSHDRSSPLEPQILTCRQRFADRSEQLVIVYWLLEEARNAGSTFLVFRRIEFKTHPALAIRGCDQVTAQEWVNQ